MYLVAYLFLMISLIGIYTQVYAVQAGRMLSNQKVLGETMLGWHNAAVGLARNVQGGVSYPPTNVPCRLSSAVSGFSDCTSALGTLVMTDSADTLPEGYNFDAYQWYSLAYTASGQNYVVTYVESPVTGNIVEYPSIGVSTGEMLKQLKKTKAPGYSYGAVMDQKLITRMENYSLPMPSGSVVPDGSVAIVSPF